MRFFTSDKYVQRKYVDLIRKAEGKWANWEPSMPHPEVGDYGRVNPDTGAFERDGSIYSDEFAEQHWSNKPRMKDEFPPVPGERETMVMIKSNSARQFDLSANHEITLANLAEASVKSTWEFRSGRGAVLLLTEPRSLSLPPNVLLKKLVNVPVLKDSYLVTSVTKCPGYALYLSDTGGDQVSLAMSANASDSIGLGVGANAGFNGNLWYQLGTGVFRLGGAPGGEDNYTPLFNLKKIRKPFIPFRRDSPPPIRVDDDLWTNGEDPWSALGEDGEDVDIIADDDVERNRSLTLPASTSNITIMIAPFTIETKTVRSNNDVLLSGYGTAELDVLVRKGQNLNLSDDDLNTVGTSVCGPAGDEVATGPRGNHIYIKEQNGRHNVGGE
ncbi:hypothetical protein FRB96_006986 [Tulasnella sp. 330]|nr:hypothetical protein FRB96_006986 [Tulasnella sp. 330]KAG8882539.1 hypothetical protein FRB98_003614 [Tulasnella sp. 332]KAG8883806.1 hypothetical protein FRB97_005809 [Tulasnella sp. 331]